LCLALALTLFFAASAPAELRAAVSVTDDAGQEIVLARPAVRVIALYGAFNEILDGLGRTEAIVARTNADKLPARIVKLPVIGTHMRPNIEAVLAQKPDLVLQMAGRKEASLPVDALRKRGVCVAMFRAASFAELMSVIRRVGTLTGADAQAETMVRGLEARLTALDAKISQTSERPRVFFEVRSPNMYSVGRGSLVTELIARAGGMNCVEERAKFARLSEEEVLRLAPEAYVIQRGPMNPAPLPLSQRPRLRALPATKAGKAWFVDEMKYSRPGPRNIDAVEELALLLHPEIAAFDARNAAAPAKGARKKDRK